MDDRHSSAAAANRRFYDAFERRDIDLMSDVWEHSDRVVCTHPGWVTLRGWGAVGGSFATLFSHGQQLQFILTEERVEVFADVAVVSLDENLLGDLGDQAAATVAALNVFVEEAGEWKLVVHHGSAVAAT